MTRAAQARVITAVLLVGLALLVLTQRRQGAEETPRPVPGASESAGGARPSPQDAIYAMFEAARDGEVRKYLDCFDGALAESLQRAAAERGEAGFARYLRESNAPVKGIAVEEPQAAAGGEVKVRVELVYAGRNEAQFYYLTKTGDRWRISRLNAAEPVETLVPYGAPAVDGQR